MNNTKQNYGWITILLHWISVIVVIGLFSLGFWMVDLGYYDTWYKIGPELHKSVGITFFVLMIVRTFWRVIQVKPQALDSHTVTERKVGHVMHLGLYIVTFAIMFSGYFISTADGRGIEIFQLFEIAGFGSFIEKQEDIAGLFHQYAAYTLIFMVVLHAGAALKHHFLDKDNTLHRMLGSK